MGFYWDIISFFKHGGFFMYPVLLVLTVGIAIIADRLIYLKKASIDGDALWSRIEADISTSKLEEAIQECKGSEAALPKVLIAGLEKAKQTKVTKEDRDELENHIEEALLTIMPQLESHTHYLPTLANVSTLFGLLGTITGLIHAFQSIAADRKSTRLNSSHGTLSRMPSSA